MKNKKIYLSAPNFIGREKYYLKDCIDSKFVSSIGRYVRDFEKKISNFTKSKYAISCNSGTSALHLGLRVIGVKPDDEVIVPTMSFIATANAVRYLGGSPIFMDCDNFFNLDVKKTISFILKSTYFENNFTYNKKTHKKISALIIVHVFGNAADIYSLLKICKNRNIKILEDAAGALGTKYLKGRLRNKFAGTIGDIGCLSFNGNKIITSGGGGMILTANSKFAKEALYLSTQARNDKINYVHDEVGYNYRLTNIHAALGLAQLEKINNFLKKKNLLHNFYCKSFKNTKGLTYNLKPIYANNNNWMLSIQLDIQKLNISKNKFVNYISKKNIEVRPIWRPLHLQIPYKTCQYVSVTNANKIYKNTFNIPSSSNLSIKDAAFVVKVIKKTLKNLSS